jgi:hypothetical protein
MNYNLYKAILPSTINYLNNEDNIAYINKYEDLMNITPNINKIFFVSNFEEPIKIGDIRYGITYVIYGYNFNMKLDEGVLPESVEFLYFISSNYEYYSLQNVLPKNLKSLILSSHSYYDNNLKKGDIPEGIKYLSLGYYFDKELNIGDLPESLECLVFGSCFNKTIAKDVLPKKLKTLIFGCNFDKKIEKDVLPEGLKKIDFGISFNQPIDIGVIPESVDYLTFSFKFNQPLVGVLPKNLKKLYLGSGFKQPIEKGILVDSITELTLYVSNNQILEKDMLPSSLTKLTIHNFNNTTIPLDAYPSKLTYLHVFIKLRNNEELKKNLFPNTLTHLHIDGYVKQTIKTGHIPHSVIDLSFNVTYHCESFNSNIEDNALPDGLINLDLGGSFFKNININNCHKLVKINIPHNYGFIKNKNLIIVHNKISNHKLYNIYNINDIKYVIENERPIIIISSHDNYMRINNGKYLEFILSNIDKHNNVMKQLKMRELHRLLAIVVFNPIRLQKICDVYEVDFSDLVSIY